MYEMGTSNGDKTFLLDSSLSNVGEIAPRHYYGADCKSFTGISGGKLNGGQSIGRDNNPAQPLQL